MDEFQKPIRTVSSAGPPTCGCDMVPSGLPGKPSANTLHGVEMPPAPPPNGLTAGLSALADGGRLVARRRDWWPLILGPILLTGLTLILALWGTLSLWDDVAQAWVRWTGIGAQRGIILVFVHITSFLLTLVSLSITAIMIGKVTAGPFLDELSARIEREALGRMDARTWSWTRAATDALRGALHSTACVTLYAAIACPLTVLQLVPVAGTLLIAPVAAAIGALFIAREAFDYSASRRSWSLSAKLLAVRRTWAPSLGLGLGAMALLAIPIANLIAMPVVVAGATLLFHRLETSGAYEES